MKYIPRNEYYKIIRETGRIPDESEYEIADLDLSTYVSKNERKIIDDVFMTLTGWNLKSLLEKSIEIDDMEV